MSGVPAGPAGPVGAIGVPADGPVRQLWRGPRPVTPDGLRPLRVELRAESDFQGVLDFLDALERGEKIVVVERLEGGDVPPPAARSSAGIFTSNQTRTGSSAGWVRSRSIATQTRGIIDRAGHRIWLDVFPDA